MTEIEKLLSELREMKATGKPSPGNNKNTWSSIGGKNWEEAGFSSEEEAKAWVENNEYANLA